MSEWPSRRWERFDGIALLALIIAGFSATAWCVVIQHEGPIIFWGMLFFAWMFSPFGQRYKAEWQRANARGADLGYLLASFKRKSPNGHIIWWLPNDAGYTDDISQAGRYVEIEPGYHDSEYTVPVPIEFVMKHRIRLGLDPGDSANAAFRSAELLRAALKEHGR